MFSSVWRMFVCVCVYVLENCSKNEISGPWSCRLYTRCKNVENLWYTCFLERASGPVRLSNVSGRHANGSRPLKGYLEITLLQTLPVIWKHEWFKTAIKFFWPHLCWSPHSRQDKWSSCAISPLFNSYVASFYPPWSQNPKGNICVQTDRCQLLVGRMLSKKQNKNKGTNIRNEFLKRFYSLPSLLHWMTPTTSSLFKNRSRPLKPDSSLLVTWQKGFNYHNQSTVWMGWTDLMQ